ncbi:MAG: hypothetical protein K6357_03735 [Elusimicrobiota bacterium]
MSDEEISKKIEDNTLKILELLSKEPMLSSWEIKLKLRISSSELYLSLGYLLAQKKIKMTLENLIYKVNLKNES